MRKALIVGVDYYESGNSLFGCVNDAYAVKSTLERNDGGFINFGCNLITATNSTNFITREILKDSIEELFKDNAEIALFYFSGHGHIEASDGYILTSESKRGDNGVSLSEILKYANESKAKNKVIILDSCHSGLFGASHLNNQVASINEGVTVLTASTKDQYATEKNGRGVFTSLLVDALNGGAANLTGDVTLGSIYAHIDQSLGVWEQRPVFKTNVKEFVSLKKVSPPISLEELRKISKLFPKEGFEFNLDPTYEPQLKGRDEGMPKPIEDNTKKFAILQKYNRLNLLIPVGVKHMWNAAMESKSCKLTALGEHYRRLAENDRI